MKIVSIVDLFGLVVEGKGFEVFVDKELSDVFDCGDDVAETEIELCQKVSIEFVDSDVVVEDNVGAFQEIVSVFLEERFEVFAFLLLFEFNPNDQVHNC